MEAMQSRFPNLVVAQHGAYRRLFTKIRDRETGDREFGHYAMRLMRILAEEGLAQINPVEETVTTPTDTTYAGEAVSGEANVCAVSIVRAGDSLLEAVRFCAPDVAVGKILIQRDEETAQPKLFYSKLPPRVAEMDVMLVDPMLATGGSAACAIQVLVDAGIPPAKILFLNVVAAPEGIERIFTDFPDVRIVTAGVDDGLNERKYIVPGLGDYGDRFFGTTG